MTFKIVSGIILNSMVNGNLTFYLLKKFCGSLFILIIAQFSFQEKRPPLVSILGAL